MTAPAPEPMAAPLVLIPATGIAVGKHPAGVEVRVYNPAAAAVLALTPEQLAGLVEQLAALSRELGSGLATPPPPRLVIPGRD